MQTGTAIRFRRERGVGDVINVTFSFIRENAALLFRCLLFIAGPAVVTSSVCSALVQVLSLQGGVAGVPDGALVAVLGLLTVATFVGAVAAAVLPYATLFGFIRLYQEHGPGGFDVGDVWAHVKQTFFGLLAMVVILVLAFFVVIVGLAIPTGLLVAVLPGLLAVLPAVACGFALVYVVVCLQLALFVYEFDAPGVLASIGRCFYLVRDNWWSTFAVFVLAMILYTILLSATMLPQYGLTFLATAHAAEGFGLYQGLLVAFSAISGVWNAVLYGVPGLAIAFHYFNLVEQKEQRGLMDRVDALGAATAPDAGTPEA